jgi:hypothetical protein
MKDDQRKPFQHLPANENPQFLEDGKRIFLEMRNKYPKNTHEDLDNILNGLCASLTVFIKYAVPDKNNHKNFLQLIWNILNKNI